MQDTGSNSLDKALVDPSRPVFLFGSAPPREGTDIEKAKLACAKFAARSAVLATDGFIVYDIQSEESRNSEERPFPFRKTMDSALYASFFPLFSAKQCVVYKSVVENSLEEFNEWLDRAVNIYGHRTFNLVGAASSADTHSGPTLQEASEAACSREGVHIGSVCIAERHTKKGNEDHNMFRKGIFAVGPLVKLLNDYGALCKSQGVVPKKVILTFAPCGRAKTLAFVKWLGMQVPEEVESRILGAATPVQESVTLLCEVLHTVLQQTAGSGIPLGINVESVSIYKEEIDAAHDLFQKLQAILLNASGSPWAVRWFFVSRPLRHFDSPDVTSRKALTNSESTEDMATVFEKFH